MNETNLTEKRAIVDRMQLFDLANILSNVTREEWENPTVRNAVIGGLLTWPPVLRRIAHNIK